MSQAQPETPESSAPTPRPVGAPPKPVTANGSPKPSPQPNEPSARKSPRSERVSRATGPRTSHGKEQSKLNARKHGLLSRAVLLKGESRAEFASLHNGLRESLDPKGRLEVELVENPAVILWRKRRLLQAERAEVSKADVLEKTLS